MLIELPEPAPGSEVLIIFCDGDRGADKSREFAVSGTGRITAL
jgi:hypothetical protein